MKLIEIGQSRFREYQHIVTMDVGRNLRWLVDFGGRLNAGPRQPYSFQAEGAIDGAGRITDEGRRAILDALSASAPSHAAPRCVVWAEDACTFVMPDETTVESRRPSWGDPVDPAEYEAVNGRVVTVSYVALPEGCPWPFLCVRLLGVDHVEISSGERVVLGWFDELPRHGPGSELRRHLDADGRLVSPRTFRGVRTAGVDGAHGLLGPVQPSGHAARVVAPWPSEVFAACEAIAGRKLPRPLLDAIWRAVEPLPSGANRTGAMEAA